MEEDVVVSPKSIFYKLYADSTFVRRKKNINYKLLQNSNCYRKTIKLTLEENSKKFLDTEVIRKTIPF